MRAPSLYISLFVAGVAAIIACGSAQAGSKHLSGPAYVIDGDTLVIRRRHVRLFGMDAFEHDQMCGRLACGRQATRTLSDLTRGRTVVCEQRDTDPYGRMVAICTLPDGRDLGQVMVRKGLAVDYRAFSDRYLKDEAAAKAARVGAWAHGFDSPAHYRLTHR